MTTHQPPEAVSVMDGVINDVTTGWMQGDDMPATEKMVDALTARGYALRKVPVDGDTLFGVPQWDDLEQLLIRYTTWLHRNGQLVPAPADEDEDDLNEDMALHFLAEQREATAARVDEIPERHR
jgi:hypothetical protein